MLQLWTIFPRPCTRTPEGNINEEQSKIWFIGNKAKTFKLFSEPSAPLEPVLISGFHSVKRMRVIVSPRMGH